MSQDYYCKYASNVNLTHMHCSVYYNNVATYKHQVPWVSIHSNLTVLLNWRQHSMSQGPHVTAINIMFHIHHDLKVLEQ
jgi:hypothetical protein